MKNNLMKNNMMQAAAPSLTMPYGKHFGEDIASVPPAYLQRFLANCCAGRLEARNGHWCPGAVTDKRAKER